MLLSLPGEATDDWLPEFKSGWGDPAARGMEKKGSVTVSPIPHFNLSSSHCDAIRISGLERGVTGLSF